MIAVSLEKGEVRLRNPRHPSRPEGFATIRLLLGGICNTDLELQRGYYGFRGIPGHEFVGVVEESDDPSLLGVRVVGEINLSCLDCDWCSRGLNRHCPRRTVLGILHQPGAFQELFTLPERNLHRVHSSISDEEAVFVEPLAAACQILDQVKIPRGADVAVLGDGKLGLLTAQVLHAHGARVHQFGKHRDKLKISERAGVTTELAGKTMPAAAYDWVVEATGSANGLQQAIRMTRPLGTVIMKSTIHDLAQIQTAPAIVNEITLIGSRCGRFAPALKLLKSRKVNVAALISEMHPLSEAPKAFANAATSGVLKVLLQGTPHG